MVTYYDARRMGACSLKPDPKAREVVAVGRGLYRQGAACGACIEVEGPKGTVRARIVDLCPGGKGASWT